MPLIEGDEEKYYSVPSTALTKSVKKGKGKTKNTINQTSNTIITSRTWKQAKIKTRN